MISNCSFITMAYILCYDYMNISIFFASKCTKGILEMRETKGRRDFSDFLGVKSINLMKLMKI